MVDLFKAAADNSTLDAALRQDKNVLFLHLLGLDTTGHAYRPYSKEYLHNIQIVDQGVEKVCKVIEDFYGDGQTAFVFTADHGMSDWGSHGDGHPDNTRTPLVVWGSGVSKPIITTQTKASGHEDGFSSDWGFDHIARHDVAQADIAALMAYLIGLEFPVNSVGELPLSYVAAPPKEKAVAALVNARGILEMYRVKEERKKETEIGYKPFAAFSAGNGSLGSRVAQIQSLIETDKFEEAIDQSRELLHVGLAGLRYLQTYDWLFLRALITTGYLGWIAFAITTVIDLHVLHGDAETSRTTSTVAIFGSFLFALYSYLLMRQSPLTYYIYAFFPIFFWEEVTARRSALLAGKTKLLAYITSKQDRLILGLQLLASVGFLELLVSVSSHREDLR